MSYKGLLGIIMVLVAVNGCGEASRKNAEDFFPLGPNMIWNYEVFVSDESGDIKERRKGTVSNLANVQLANNFATPQKYYTETVNSQQHTTSTEFISQDNDGIFRLAIQKENEDAPAVGMRLYYILNPIKVGTTKKYGSDDAYQSISIDSISDIVNVPAGTFKDCLKVNFTAKDKSGIYQNTSWYAPNIGRVIKIIVFPNKNKMVSQLISYKK